MSTQTQNLSTSSPLNRRDFTGTILHAGAASASSAVHPFAADALAKRLRTAAIGCGSVSDQWIPFRCADERYRRNKERTRRMHSEKPADERAVRVIRSDGTEVTLVEPARF